MDLNIEVVIGANYGDEGKGLFTDYLCANRPNPIVILNNGGSQRGHTVEIEKPDGSYLRHVFHHFGSGTFRYAPTFFTKSFLLNPMQFVKEYNELKDLGYTPNSYRDPNCIIQLPCDIALNWHIEQSRKVRHGSVGCGIWETKYRMYNGNSITLQDFCSLTYDEQVRYIKDQAVKYRTVRCNEEGISEYADIYDLFLSNGFIDHFIADCNYMNIKCPVMSLKDCCDIEAAVNSAVTLVFENGQGLKLDQFYGAQDEANTTPSFTGIVGVAKYLNEEYSKAYINSMAITVNYISRTYLTKHGAGIFSEHNSKDENFSFADSTNIYNPWQGDLRFASLDYDQLFDRCNKDFEMLKTFLLTVPGIIFEKNIVLTHANEVAVDEKHLNNIDFVSNGKLSKEISCINKK